MRGNRSKVFASWGYFYEQIPMDLVIRSFSYERQPRIVNHDPVSVTPDAGAESDLDLLLVVRNEAAGKKRRLRRAGYLLAAEGQAVPSIMAYTSQEWERLRQSRSPFCKAVERDEVRVL